MAKMNATNVLNAFHDFLNDDEDSDGHRLAEFLAKNKPAARRPLFGDIQPDSFDFHIQLEAVETNNATANNSKRQMNAGAASPAIVIEQQQLPTAPDKETCNKNVPTPIITIKSPQSAKLPPSERYSLRRSSAIRSADRLRRYTFNRLSATKCRSLIKEFESTVCSDEFSPHLYSTRMDMQRNSVCNSNSKENCARTFTVEKTNDPNQILLQYIDQSPSAATTSKQTTPTKGNSPAKMLSRLLTPLRMASMSRITSPKLASPNRITTPSANLRTSIGCKSPRASPCHASALHLAHNATMTNNNKSNVSVARENPRNRTVLAENTPTRASTPPLEEDMNVVDDDGIHVPETQDLPAGTQNLIAACRRSQTPVIVIPVTQIVRSGGDGDTTPTHRPSHNKTVNKTPSKINRTLQSPSVTTHEMPAQMSIKSIGQRTPTTMHQTPSKLRLSDIMTDDELEASAPTVSSSLTADRDTTTINTTTNKPLNLAKKRKPRKHSSTAREKEAQIPKVATHRAPLNLRHKRNKEQYEMPTQLPLNKAPCTPINGEKFAVELKMNLARMTNRQILDLRKRNSMGKIFLSGAANTLPLKKLAMEQQLQLEESIQWELLKRDIEDESPRHATLISIAATPPPPAQSLRKRRKSRSSMLLPPPQFCDSYELRSTWNMPVENEIEVETTHTHQHAAYAMANGELIENVAVENVTNEVGVADVVIDVVTHNAKNDTPQRDHEPDELAQLVQGIADNELESLADESRCDRITFNPSRTSTVDQGKTKLRTRKTTTPNTVRKYLTETKRVRKRNTIPQYSSKRPLYTKGQSDTEDEKISDISGIQDLSPKSCTLTHAAKTNGSRRSSPATPNMKSISVLPVPPTPFNDAIQQELEQPNELPVEASCSAVAATRAAAEEEEKNETFKKPAPVKNKPKARGKNNSITRKRSSAAHNATSTETSGTEGTQSEDTTTGETTLRRSKRSQAARKNNWSMRSADPIPLPEVMYMSLLLKRLNTAERKKRKFNSYADVLDAIKSEVNDEQAKITNATIRSRSRTKTAAKVAKPNSNADTAAVPEEQPIEKPQKNTSSKRRKNNSSTRSSRATSTSTADDIEPQSDTISKLLLPTIMEDVPDSSATLRTQSQLEKRHGNTELSNIQNNSTISLERSRLQITSAPVEQINRLFENRREQEVQMQNTTEASSSSDSSNKLKRLRVRVRRTPVPETPVKPIRNNKRTNNKQTKAPKEEPPTTANTQADKNFELISWLKSVTSLDKNKSKDYLFQELRCSSLDNVVITELDGIDSVFYTNKDENNSDLGYLRFKPQQMKPPKRSKSHSLNYVVLTGKFKIVTHNEVGLFQNGDLVTINKGMRYSIKNETDDIGILMVVRK